ncbi:hypothetical protein [Anderseniella sp. Alg231-50]|uniref:hypothetical protein n=1 Tax=Anderseniella sp. Alg231-50 TaxID=1922226 RepID=UPI000D55029E
MRIIKVLSTVAALSALAVSQVQAADLSTAAGLAQCVGDYRSGLLDLPRPDVDDAVNGMYQRALDVSQRETTIASTSTVFTWSNEAKVACAKAIGFLKSDDVNGYQISQCDCFYGRMQMAIDRR